MTDTSPKSNGGTNDAESDSSPDGLPDFMLDVRQLTRLVADQAVSILDTDGRVAAWNEGARQLTGYEEEEILGQHYRIFFPPAERSNGRPEELLERARTEGQVEDEGWRHRSDGSRFRAREVLVPIREDEISGSSSSNGNGTSGQTTDEPADIVGFGRFLQDRTEQYERERELREEKALTESIFEAQPDVLYAYDTEGNLLHWNDRFERLSDYDIEELEAVNPLDFIAPPDRDHIADAIQRILEDGERVTAEARVVTGDGEYVPYEFNSARITDEDGTVLGFTGVGRDISDRKARERELERLERLNAVIRTIDETMVAAESRGEVEAAIVEAFADADAYRFAVIGRVDRTVASDRRRVEPHARSGIDPSGAETVLPAFADPQADGPAESVLEAGTVRCYRELRESDVDDWRRDARERDYGSVAVVPIVASGRTYGLLVVAAAESTAFTDREREILQEFGGTLGHAINAMAVRRLLYQDVAVEIEFESTDWGDVCVDLSGRLDCWLSVDHVLSLTDDRFSYSVTVADVDPDRFRSVVADHPAIEEFRAIDAGGAESHWELVVAGSTITGLLADYGARMQSRVADHGVSTTVVQVSPDVEVRDLVDAVTDAYPETRLVSKRTVERPVETTGDFRRRVAEELTEKQRTALEAAYYGGYFDWPTRRSDASEIADRLGIARQTFHQHLRVAQEKLLTAYFEDGAAVDRDRAG